MNKNAEYYEQSHFSDACEQQNTKPQGRLLLFSFYLITGFMFIEAISGWLIGSLALLSDAGHMLSDAMALGATLLAFKIGERAATKSKTFGFKRFEILVAGINGSTLIIISFMIVFEAFDRLSNPEPIQTTGMLVVAVLGFIINVIVAWLLHSGMNQHGHCHGHSHNKSSGEKNLNMHSAYLHVLGDLLGSVAAMIAALLIRWFDWVWADPIASFMVALIISVSGYRVVSQAVHILMQGAPKHIPQNVVAEAIIAFPQVISLHDLHIWSMTNELHLLSCHIVVDGTLSVETSSQLLTEIDEKLTTLGINHSTIQVESNMHPQEMLTQCQLNSNTA